MEKIRTQINDIITYNCDDFNALTAHYNALNNRINEGIMKMKEAGVFSDAEIQEISTFAHNLRRDRYTEAKKVLIENMRNAFEF